MPIEGAIHLRSHSIPLKAFIFITITLFPLSSPPLQNKCTAWAGIHKRGTMGKFTVTLISEATSVRHPYTSRLTGVHIQRLRTYPLHLSREDRHHLAPFLTAGRQSGRASTPGWGFWQSIVFQKDSVVPWRQSVSRDWVKGIAVCWRDVHDRCGVSRRDEWRGCRFLQDFVWGWLWLYQVRSI